MRELTARINMVLKYQTLDASFCRFVADYLYNEERRGIVVLWDRDKTTCRDLMLAGF